MASKLGPDNKKIVLSFEKPASTEDQTVAGMVTLVVTDPITGVITYDTEE